jgi:NAD(P)-dependent dehydrogenase (short-subunit alcohol dehydrogenase family)
MSIWAATKGIGAAIATLFLDRGYNVVATSRGVSKTGAFPASDRLALVDGKVSEAATAARVSEIAVSTFGSLALDALVNNAGIFFSKSFLDYRIEDLRALAAVNLEGFLFMTQAAIRQMLAQKSGGSIVTITASRPLREISPWNLQRMAFASTRWRRGRSTRRCSKISLKTFCDLWRRRTASPRRKTLRKQCSILRMPLKSPEKHSMSMVERTLENGNGH